MNTDTVLLEIENLKTHFAMDEGEVKAVDGVDLRIHDRETLCVVGESGCGKSITARSILLLVDPPGRIVDGRINFRLTDTTTVDIASMHPKGKPIRAIRGNDIAMIFQEPMTSLSPVHTVGDQMMEAIRLHMTIDRVEAKERVIAMLDRVGIPKGRERFSSYPFELSGGMRQRVVIGMALLCEARLLIADEPTTALDVTTQANILDLIAELKREMGMSVLFITHDLGVVAEIADTVAVMYLGQIVEYGDVRSIFHDPKHPYLQALLRSIPKLGLDGSSRLDSIKGMVPHPYRRPAGCPFHTRCHLVINNVCDRIVPKDYVIGKGRTVKCHLYGDTIPSQSPAGEES